MTTLSKTFSTVGSGAAVSLGVVCPACVPAVGAFLAAIGLPILASASVLKPLLFVFLALAAVGFINGYRQHRVFWPLFGAVLGAVGIYIGRWEVFNTPLIYLGAALLLTSSTGNVILRRRTNSCCSGTCELNRGE